jgi:hypothetical protein
VGQSIRTLTLRVFKIIYRPNALPLQSFFIETNRDRQNKIMLGINEKGKKLSGAINN